MLALVRSKKCSAYTLWDNAAFNATDSRGCNLTSRVQACLLGIGLRRKKLTI